MLNAKFHIGGTYKRRIEFPINLTMEKYFKIGQLTLARKLQKARRMTSANRYWMTPRFANGKLRESHFAVGADKALNVYYKGNCREDAPGNRHGTREPCTTSQEIISEIVLMCVWSV